MYGASPFPAPSDVTEVMVADVSVVQDDTPADAAAAAAAAVAAPPSPPRLAAMITYVDALHVLALKGAETPSSLLYHLGVRPGKDSKGALGNSLLKNRNEYGLVPIINPNPTDQPH